MTKEVLPGLGSGALLSLSSLPESAAQKCTRHFKENCELCAAITKSLMPASTAIVGSQLGEVTAVNSGIALAHSAFPDPRKAGSEVREADSEIREALAKWLHLKMCAAQNLEWKEGDRCDECDESVELELLPLLAPSRQGAGGK